MIIVGDLMYLSQIKLFNYRPYFQEQIINLGYDENKNVNVIFANNAIGKSSLLNAITWAFYGKELHDTEKKENKVYNKIARDNCVPGDNLYVKVELKLYDYDEHGNKIHFQVKRCWRYEIHENKEPTFEEETLNVLGFDGEWEDDDKGQLIIDSTISKLMHKYFFFNGEQLKDYFDRKDLKKTIERISQINLISRVNNNFSYVDSLYNDKISDLDVDLKPVTDELNLQNQNLKEAQNEKKIRNTEKDQLNSAIDTYDKRLKVLEEAKDLAKERDNLLSENSRLNNTLEKDRKQYVDGVIEVYNIVNLFDVLLNVSKIKINKDSHGISLYTLLKVYKSILNEDICVCGVDFNKNPKHRLELEKKIEELSSSIGSKSEKDDVSDSISDIESMLETLSDKYNFINVLREKISENERSVQTNENRLIEISTLLIDDEESEVQEIEKMRQTNVERLNKVTKQLDKLRDKISDTKSEIKRLSKDRDDILANKSEKTDLERQLEFCEEAIVIVEDLDKNLKKNILDKITGIISKQIVNNNFSDDKFKHVMIDDNFDVSLKDYLGDKIIPGDLSGGEKRILALSFIVALNNISGFDLPLFIDAPFSALDNANKQLFMDNLPIFTRNKQIIFLFIGDDYKDYVEDMITPYRNKKIELVKKQTYITEVKEHE